MPFSRRYLSLNLYLFQYQRTWVLDGARFGLQLAVLAHIRFDAERIVALCQVDGHDKNQRIVGRQPDFKFLVHLKLVPQIALAKPFARRVLALNANTIGKSDGAALQVPVRLPLRLTILPFRLDSGIKRTRVPVICFALTSFSVFTPCPVAMQV